MSDDFVKNTRAYILEQFLGIEVKIEQIIAAYYLGDQRNPMFIPFQMQVLRNAYCSFALKRRVLEQILALHFSNDAESSRGLKGLHKLSKIRNLYAHCGRRFVYKPDKDERIIFTPDPEFPTKAISFEKKYSQFNETFPIIDTWLRKLLEKMPAKSEEASNAFKTALNSNLRPESAI